MTGSPPIRDRTITGSPDQRKEMALHQEIAVALGTTAVHFCDPHSPWQHPTNENTNGLLRDWFPKGTDLSVHTADDIARVRAERNERLLGSSTGRRRPSVWLPLSDQRPCRDVDRDPRDGQAHAVVHALRRCCRYGRSRPQGRDRDGGHPVGEFVDAWSCVQHEAGRERIPQPVAEAQQVARVGAHGGGAGLHLEGHHAAAP